MASHTPRELQRLKELDREIQLLKHTAALASWDQETYMPKGAIQGRAEQISLLEGLQHEKMTSTEYGDLLAALQGADVGELSAVDRALLREARRQYDRLAKLPADLVRKLARETSLAQARWVQAKEQADFSLFAPNLQRLIDLTIEKADLIGYTEDRYDALLDEFEPWMKASDVEAVFAPLQKKLRELLSRIRGSSRQVENGVLCKHYPAAKQRTFSERILKKMGFDESTSRLDLSAHPFTITLGSTDVRLTTRFDEGFINAGIFSCIHEGGHALYELGFDKALWGSLLADGASLGIHESQSRMWENMIGRSEPFWRHFYPGLQEAFPGNLKDVPLADFYRAVNKVEPSLIRTEADEVTYNLHIILRFNVERKILSGDLAVSDVPEAWRGESRELLGISPENDAQGALQDIHWSMGAFGYFPTYCLGNIYAAQFFEVLQRDMPDIGERLTAGSLQPVLQWLRDRIHRHGCSFSAQELCRSITGRELEADPFVAYLQKKYGEIYGF